MHVWGVPSLFDRLWPTCDRLWPEEGLCDCLWPEETTVARDKDRPLGAVGGEAPTHTHFLLLSTSPLSHTEPDWGYAAYHR